MTNSIQRHPFHLVDSSPWPFAAGLSSLATTTGFVVYMHFYSFGLIFFYFGLLSLILIAFNWWKDIVRESTYQGHHTKRVQKGLKYGMLLFILSEIMFFFAFFWAFFSASLSPSHELGCFWPPPGIDVLNAWEIPLLNTSILLLSGATCTWSHNLIVIGKRKEAIFSLSFTVFLGILFTFLQGFEYLSSNFSMADSVYGSIFFLATGFHGVHVALGTLFLFVCLLRLNKHHFTVEHHFGFEAAAWYWHFVDCVWLFLFVAIYWWGGL